VPLRILPGWLSLLPPVLAIGLALLIRQVIVALLLGVWVGAWILYDWNPLLAFLRLGDRFLVAALSDTSHATILLFSTILGGMVGILSRCGATEGVVRYLAGRVKGRRGGQASTALMGTVIFFDDYANTLLVGNTMRPLTDRLRISREKLSYLVDSTAAPVATVAVISTWVGFEVGLIQDAMAKLGDGGSAYTFFLRSIPYGYYPLLTLFFVYMVSILGRDFGPMLTAEQRTVTSGRVLRRGAQPASDTQLFEAQETRCTPAHPLLAVVPIVVIVLVTGFGLWADGRQQMAEQGVFHPTTHQILNAADSYAVLMWACLSGAVVAGGLAWGTRRLSLRETVEGWLAGAKAMLIAVVILLLAWSLSEVCNVLQTAPFVVQLCQEGLPVRLLPTVVFVLSGAIGFATGTSWGTMAILMPLVYPLGVALPAYAGLEPGVSQGIHLAAVSAVLAGAVFGDHCSPISDTTILSSLASGADHIDHVRTQLPYAATVALVGILVGYLPVGFGVRPWYSLMAGGLILFLFLFWRGRSPGAGEGPS
jgi:Na+/H+ antiporter NhaC